VTYKCWYVGVGVQGESGGRVARVARDTRFESFCPDQSERGYNLEAVASLRLVGHHQGAIIKAPPSRHHHQGTTMKTTP